MSVSISSVVSGSVLNASTSLVDAITMQAQGAVTQVDLVYWLCSNRFDLSQCGMLMGVLDSPTFGQVMQAQTALISAAASKQSGGVISCKISKKGAISLYGLGEWPITLYVAQWERFFGSQGGVDKDKSSILKLANDANATSDFCFADYIFAKTKDGYGAMSKKGEDIKYATKLAKGEFSESHSFIIDGKPAKSSSTAMEMMDQLASGPSDGQLDDIRKKCAGIKIVVRLSRKPV